MCQLFLLIALIELSVFPLLVQGRAAEPEKLTPYTIKKILDLHNRIRRKEYAGNMRRMQWNLDLENIALRLNPVCFNHSRSKDRTYNSEPTGENIVAGISYDQFDQPDGDDGWLEGWWATEEKRNYDFSTRTCKPNKVCGNYTQLVWWASYQVGCALKPKNAPSIQCPNPEHNDWWVVRCLYFPAPAVNHKKRVVDSEPSSQLPPFIQAKPCSKCGEGEPKYQQNSKWKDCVCGLCENDYWEEAEECTQKPPSPPSAAYPTAMSPTLLTIGLLVSGVTWQISG